MTVDPEGVLEPGEQIVFRAKGRSYRSYTIMHSLAQIPCFAGFVIPITIVNPSIGLVVLLAVSAAGLIQLAILWGFIASQRRNPDDFAITDRRLLFADSYWDDNLETMPLAEIQEIRWSTTGQVRCLSFLGKEGELVLPPQRDDERIAQEVATATGLATPPRLGSFFAIDPDQFALTPIFFFTCRAFFTAAVLVEPFFTGEAAFWIRLLLLCALTASAALLGNLIGLALLFALFRLTIPAERMRLFLCAGKEDRWPTRLALRVSAFLYRQPMPYATY